MVEAGVLALCLLVTAATSVGAGPTGYRGEDAIAMAPSAPKLGSGRVAVGTGQVSTITTEASVNAVHGAKDTLRAMPITDCVRRGSLLVVEGRYNAGRRVECGAYTCFHLSVT